MGEKATSKKDDRIEIEAENGKLKKDLARLKKAIKNKKFGLVWMDVPEKFEEKAENAMPVLKEVPEKAVINKDGKPTHILIEGDNYHALTCLNYTHKGKIDVVYIDPPYNTGGRMSRSQLEVWLLLSKRRLILYYPDGTYHQDGVAIAFFQPSTTLGTSSFGLGLNSFIALAIG